MYKCWTKDQKGSARSCGGQNFSINSVGDWVLQWLICSSHLQNELEKKDPPWYTFLPLSRPPTILTSTLILEHWGRQHEGETA